MSKAGRVSARRTSRSSKGLPKVSSGIAGLEEILEGGFPAGRTALISGGPGTGKTMLALEFLYRSALAGHSGILLLFEERAEAIRRNALSLGWNLAELEKAGKLFIRESRLERDAILSGDFNITPLLAIIQGRARQIKAKRIVIDAISATLRMGDARSAFDYLMKLVDFSKRRGMTCLTTNQLPDSDVETDFSGLGISSLLDTIVVLRYVSLRTQVTRSLLILKSRGSKHSNSYHKYVITDNGIYIRAMPSEAKQEATQSVHRPKYGTLGTVGTSK